MTGATAAANVSAPAVRVALTVSEMGAAEPKRARQGAQAHFRAVTQMCDLLDAATALDPAGRSTHAGVA